MQNIKSPKLVSNFERWCILIWWRFTFSRTYISL